MHLIYLDDSASYDKRYQLVGGVILDDEHFTALEQTLAVVIEELVPEELRESFEFHASDLFNTRGPFSAMEKTKALKILEQCIEWVTSLKIPVLFGAVDVDKHEQTIWGNAHPIAVGFRICLEAIESWFRSEKLPENSMGLIIFDEIKKPEVKQAVQTAFRTFRKRVRRASFDAILAGTPVKERGLLEHIHDDLYFGDSAYSVGLQAADVCTYFINRHLNGREDTEHIYERLEPFIVCERIVPE